MEQDTNSNENSELYNSAIEKMQSLYKTVFDEKGNLKPEFKLTDDEIKAFHNYPDDLKSKSDRQLEDLFSNIVYNKYTYICGTIISNIYEICRELVPLWWKQFYQHYGVAGFAYPTGHDDNMSYEIMKDYGPNEDYHIKIFLSNLDGKYDCIITLLQPKNTLKPKGEIIFQRISTVEDHSPFRFKYDSVVTYDLNQIYSHEIVDVLFIIKEKMGKVLDDIKKQLSQDQDEQFFNKSK
jgi:hypothetical protein